MLKADGRLFTYHPRGFFSSKLKLIRCLFIDIDGFLFVWCIFCSCVLYRMWEFNFHPCCSSVWVSLKCACINVVRCKCVFEGVCLRACVSVCVSELYPCPHHHQTNMSMSPFAPVAFLYLLLLHIVFFTPVMLQEDLGANCPSPCECEDVECRINCWWMITSCHGRNMHCI